jgi:hypothetical protein
MSRDYSADACVGSRSRQIRALEHRLVSNRRNAADRAGRLRQLLLARLASPVALLGAAAVGFMLHRSRILRRTPPPVASRAAVAGSGLSLALIVQSFGLAGALVDLLRATAPQPTAGRVSGR